MKKNKTLLTSLFFLITYMISAQSIIEAGKYEDLKTSPKIAIAGGGSLMDWANLNLYHERNQALKKVSDPNRVVFIGNSITENWQIFDEKFFIDNSFVNRGIGGQCYFDLNRMLLI